MPRTPAHQAPFLSWPVLLPHLSGQIQHWQDRACILGQEGSRGLGVPALPNAPGVTSPGPTPSPPSCHEGRQEMPVGTRGATKTWEAALCSPGFWMFAATSPKHASAFATQGHPGREPPGRQGGGGSVFSTRTRPNPSRQEVQVLGQEQTLGTFP